MINIKRMVFSLPAKQSVQLFSFKLLFSLIYFLGGSVISIAQTSEVIITVNWPDWSSENKVELYNSSNVLQGPAICNTTTCYDGSSDNNYATSVNMGCIDDGSGYYLKLYDFYGDGWNGSGTVSVTSGGITVLNSLTFPNPGNCSNCEETVNSSTFTVSGAGGSCGSSGGGSSGNLTCSAGSNEITGTVFEDYNYDGDYDSGENLGVESVTVTATDSLGNSFTDNTDASGDFAITGLTAGRTYRIEFTNIPAWANPTFYGGDNGTLVQYMQSGNCANLGVAYPADYCDPNPLLVTPCYVNGDPLLGGSSADGDWMVFFQDDDSGEIGGTGYTAPQKKITGDTIGSVWGMSYHRQSGYVLAGALMKRHCGFGKYGTGAIYKIDKLGNPSLFVDLNTFSNVNTGSDTRGTTNNTLPASKTTATRDINAFQAVGKIGFGDFAISDDDQYLFAVNLNERTLIKINVGDNLTIPASVDTFDISGRIAGLLSGTSIACGSAADYRPWGLKYYRGLLYIGVVCSAESSQTASELHAYVVSFDPNNPSSGFSLVADMALDYDREAAFQSDNPSQTLAGTWRPWGLSFADAISTPWRGIALPSPILSDIEFDADGSMILGFLDRFGMQGGYRQFSTNLGDSNADYQAMQAGDLIRFCNVSGVLTKENGTTCAYNTSPPWTNPPTDLVYEDEFYAEEEYFTTSTNPNHGHPETALGALAFLPGSGEISAGVYDPFALRSGGIAWYSNTDGSTNKEYELYESADQGTPDGTFGKASALGDLEFMCSPAPIEIGNYVWEDTNGDGIQDAGEPGIEGVRIELYDDAGTLLAFDLTDSLGLYSFSGNGIDDATWQTSDDTLSANTDYYIVAGGNGQFASGGMILSGTTYILTSDSLGSSGNRYEIDSDGTIAVGVDSDFDGEPYVKITTGSIGEVDHSFDFGFKPPCTITSSISSINCAGSGPYTADWQIAVDYTGEPLGDITYQRNSLTTASFTPNTSPDTITISGIEADGGAYDTIRVYFANETTCGDTMILKRPSPCPTTIPGSETGEICASVATTEIKGTVFEDWNYDGIMNQSDTIGVLGVQVTATDCSGNTFTTYTDANGNYQFTALNQDTTYRIEFNLPDYVACWAKPTKAGNDNGTSVQFVTPGNCSNLGVASPADYCETDPRVAIPCFVNGDNNNTEDAFIAFDYSATGATANGNKVELANDSEVGAIWGVAYHRESKTIYTSAVQKRHVGYDNGATGAIYQVDNTNPASPVPSLFMTVSNTGSDPHTGLPTGGNNLTPSQDSLSYDLVGKMSLGDIDISEDGKTLWVTNLNTRSLVKIDIATASETATYALPASFCDNLTETRPWAVEVHKGEVYVGLVCSGEDDGTFSASVVKLLANGSFQEVAPVDLSYTKEETWTFDNGGSCSYPAPSFWKAWTDQWVPTICANPFGSNDNYLHYEQPILADIEFDVDGSLILGFLDRFGMQSGPRNYKPDQPNGNTDTYYPFSGGDILRLCNINGSYVQESNGGSCGFNNSNEYYIGDVFINSSSAEQHKETSLGSFAFLRGSGDILMAAFDALNNSPYAEGVNAGGVRWLSNTSGDYQRGYLIYENTITNGAGTFAKATGLGDMALLCAPAPLEIGNYVWLDDNKNGIQDACEFGIDGVAIELVKNGTVIATTQTANGGRYYFSDKNATDANLIWSGTGTDTALVANMAYTVQIVNAEGGSQQGTLNSYELTTHNSAGNDNIDSDGVISGDTASVTANVLDYGCTDHSFDFGFSQNLCSVTIDTFFTQNCSGTGAAQSGDLSVVVSWIDAPAGEDITVTLDNGDSQTIAASTSASSPDTVIFTDLNANYGVDYQVIATFETTTSCADTNSVYLECSEICSDNLNTYLMSWSDIGWVNPSNSSDYPNYTQTLTNVDGSGVDMTVIVHQEGHTNLSSFQMANPGCDTDRCDFETELTTYLPNGEVLRKFRQNNTTVDSITISFSEPILMDTFMFGGNRPPVLGQYGVSQLTFWDGPDGTGNRVGPNNRSYADITKVDSITVETPLSTTAPMNVLQGTTTGSTSNVTLGTQTMAYANGSFYSFGEEKTSTRRPWGVLNLDSVYIQSIKWYIYASTSNDPANTIDNRVTSGALSAYISSFSFQKCETGCTEQPYIGADQAICSGDTITFIAYPSQADQTDSIAGNWTISPQIPSTANIASVTNDSVIQVVFYATGLGPFVDTVYFETADGCRDTALMVVNTRPEFMASDTSVCSGQPVNLTEQITLYENVLSPVWYEGSVGGTTIGSPSSVTSTTTKTYYLVGNNVHGCKDTVSVTVTIFGDPTPSLSNVTICLGTMTILDPGSFASYNWSSTEMTQSVTKGAGTYTVTVTDGNGCTASATSIVTEGTFTADVVTVCNDNGTAADDSDDYFTIQITASNSEAGVSNKYLVIYNSTTMNVGGTDYGSQVTIGAGKEFDADGIATYTLTIRDIDDASCEIMESVGPVAECSDCPSPVCLPVTILKE